MVLTILAGALILGSAATKSKVIYANAIQSNEPSQQCKDSANKISDKAEASESGGVCDIELSRDSPSMQLRGHNFNEFTPQDGLWHGIAPNATDWCVTFFKH